MIALKTELLQVATPLLLIIQMKAVEKTLTKTVKTKVGLGSTKKNEMPGIWTIPGIIIL